MKPVELVKHPEGGRFQEVFRSKATITTSSGATRHALTHIYFSLDSGEVSRFHQVMSDEVWNLYEGAGLRLYLWDDINRQLSLTELSATTKEFCHVVPAGVWQAAEPVGDKALVGCSVGPGFDFIDFKLIEPASALAQRIQQTDAELRRFV